MSRAPRPLRRRAHAWLVLAAAAAATACSGTDATEAGGTTTTTPRDCGVSDLLVPDCGAWFGATTPSADGTYDYAVGYDEYVDVVGRAPDVLRFYERGGAPFPNELERSLATRGGRRSLLHFSWKPAPELTWRQVADGGADDAIDVVAASLSAYPHRLFLTIHHEPENDVRTEPGSGMTADDYVDMYRHVVARLRERGVDNAVYVMSYIGFDRWYWLVEDLYPGDDVVDWVAYDPYGLEAHRTFTEVLNDPNPETGWPGFYEWATEFAPDKPLMLAEWGFDLPTQPWAVDAVAEAADVLESGFPRVKAIVYWNDRTDQVDARLQQPTEVAEQFASAFREIARDPYFSATSVERAP